MTPRLAVTREQAEQMVCVPKNGQYYSADEWVLPESLTLRLPERPTMPCPHTLHIHPVPIPEGTRVEVGVRDVVTRDDWPEYPDVRWVPVAFATLDEVHIPMPPPHVTEGDWLITLSDIEPAGEDQ